MSSWKFNHVDSIGRNVKADTRCRAMYSELDSTPIPMLTDNLELQVEIEQLVINYFVRGYKKAEKKYQHKISELNHQKKVYLERIKGLEAMLKETNDGKDYFKKNRDNK